MAGSAHTVYLIKPTQLVDGRPLKFERAMTPTRALPYLAALTPSEFDVSIIDDCIEDIDFDAPVDLVGITSLLPQVPRQVQIADEFRKRGVKVVAGGVGASALPEVVGPHVDSLVVGEADELWPRVLADFKQGRMQPLYRSDHHFSMRNMPVPRFDLLNAGSYMRSTRASSAEGLSRIPIETSRGCPHNCAFCYVSRHFGRKVRFRPITDVVHEVEQFPGAYVFFVDDNIAVNPRRARELFKALIPLKIRWVGQFSVLAAKYPDLLELAAESGCMNAFIGLESVSIDNLSTVRKEFSLSQSIGETLGAFRRAGIDPHVSLVFGFDNDTPEMIDRTFAEMVRHRVHLLYAFILTPLAGTELHEQMARENRILHSDYSLYDTSHAVFRPRLMSPEVLEEKYWQAYERFYSLPTVLRRFSDVGGWLRSGRVRSSVHNFLGNLYFGKLIRKRFHPLTGGIPRREASADSG